MLDNKFVLPPIAVILLDILYSLHKLLRYCGPPAFGPAPDLPCPPKG